jgi:hypothetical protein
MPPTTRKKSGNPAKAAKQTTSAKDWKAKSARMDLELPSGNVCLVKRPGLPQLISANVMPDMLSQLAQNAVDVGKNGGKLPPNIEQKIMEDTFATPDGLEKMLLGFARITAYCVIEPTVLFHQRKVDEAAVNSKWEDIPLEDRDAEILYTDEVDMNDQMFIFNFVVGGSADLTDFRERLGESVERLELESGAQKDSV